MRVVLEQKGVQKFRGIYAPTPVALDMSRPLGLIPAVGIPSELRGIQDGTRVLRWYSSPGAPDPYPSKCSSRKPSLFSDRSDPLDVANCSGFRPEIQVDGQSVGWAVQLNLSIPLQPAQRKTGGTRDELLAAALVRG